MPFDLFAATIADLPAVVSVFHAAFDEDPNFKWMCPDCDPAEIYSWNLENFRQTWNKPGRRLFKAVDMDKETGQIAGFAKWWFPHTLTPAQRAEEELAQRNPSPPLPGSNVALCQEVEHQLAEGREKWFIPSAMYFMEILAVHPAYQRRGLGSQMLEPILGLADRERRKIYIEASKKGVGLFRQYGWVQVDALLLDTRPYGGGEHRGDGADDTGARVRENDCCVRRGDTVVSRVHQI